MYTPVCDRAQAVVLASLNDTGEMNSVGRASVLLKRGNERLKRR